MGNGFKLEELAVLVVNSGGKSVHLTPVIWLILPLFFLEEEIGFFQSQADFCLQKLCLMMLQTLCKYRNAITFFMSRWFFLLAMSNTLHAVK